MGRVEFINPNEPSQPKGGVYRWFYKKEKEEVTIYVGSAGLNKNTARFPSTLARGASELQRAHISSDSDSGYKKLDTDFIVGSAIKFLGEKGVICKWEHINNNPKEESNLCREYKPKLQPNSTRIAPKYRMECEQGWNKARVEEGEKKLYNEFEKLFFNRIEATNERKE